MALPVRVPTLRGVARPWAQPLKIKYITFLTLTLMSQCSGAKVTCKLLCLLFTVALVWRCATHEERVGMEDVYVAWDPDLKGQ